MTTDNFQDSYEKYMLIHQVTGTYLETDNYGCNINEAIQTWHEDPPRNDKGYQGHLWDLVKEDKEDKGIYRIRSWQKNSTHDEKLYLEASAKTPKEWRNAYPRLQRRSDSELQLWKLTPVNDDPDPDTFAIQPKIFPDYALGIQNNNCTSHVYVIANRTWGKPTFHHYWRLSKPVIE